MGKDAREFIDFLAEAGQTYWQILPLGPTGFGNSPYQALSSYAGNIYLIDLDRLIDTRLLKKTEVSKIKWGKKPDAVDYGILYNEVRLGDDLDVDLDAIRAAITGKTKVVAMQRSTGYDWRPAISVESLRKVTELVHSIDPSIIVMLDNCYGEFVDVTEPTDFGVDVMAGSLIKNPGGGIALSGGYIVGREDLIEKISYRLTCPGIGAECGLTFGQNRNVMQGLFVAPGVVNAALKGAILAGTVYDRLGFEVVPAADAKRSDIIQAIKFLTAERTVAFCQAVQSASPIDSYVTPMPWDMPGYEDQVVMAAGAFVQGSSIELSADAPLREPYIAYFQGGLSYWHSRFGVIKSLDALYKKGLITL
jgi:cystathionine beta-lyase family protein involved in aluminum resistance